MDLSEMKEKFYECVKSRSHKTNSFLMSTEKYLKLIEEVKAAKSGKSKDNRNYWLLRHYDVINVNGEEKLIFPILNSEVLFYVVVEELFVILYEIHVAIGHGGRDRMRKELQQRYKNITVQDIQTFLNLCEPCLQKRKSEKKRLVVNSITSSHVNTRSEVNLIDYQSQADGDFKFIMVYQDLSTRFLILRPLKSKKTSEVAKQLLDIFLLFGAPSTLESEDEGEFVMQIIDDLKRTWSELKDINGAQRHSQYQQSVENVSQAVQNMLTKWMEQEQCKNWSQGLGFVQFMKNRELHPEIKKSPFEAMFAHPSKVGLSSSSLPHVIHNINSDEDLENPSTENDMQNEDTCEEKVQCMDEIKTENTIQVKTEALDEVKTDDDKNPYLKLYHCNKVFFE